MRKPQQQELIASDVEVLEVTGPELAALACDADAGYCHLASMERTKHNGVWLLTVVRLVGPQLETQLTRGPI